MFTTLVVNWKSEESGYVCSALAESDINKKKNGPDEVCSLLLSGREHEQFFVANQYLR